MESHAQEKYQRFSIELAADGVSELDQTRRNVFIPRAEILEIHLRHGIAAERPVLTAILGVAAIAAGLWPLWWLFEVMRSGGRFRVEAIGGAAFLYLGWWLIRNTVRRRYYLAVRTPKEVRKLGLTGPVDLPGLNEMVEAARSRFGYSIVVPAGGSNMAKTQSEHAHQ